MSKRGGETMDHLMLHCSVARETWDMVFALFGVPRVMLGKVVHLLPIGSASRGEEMQETLKDVGGKLLYLNCTSSELCSNGLAVMFI